MKHSFVFLVLAVTTVAGCKEDASAGTERAGPPKLVEHRESKPKICADCGTVEAINQMRKEGDSTGAGAALGAVLGGVLGHQLGKGRGRDVATVAGAIAGGAGGYEAEKQVRAQTYYAVVVHMEDGTTRTINVSDAAGLAIGGKVRIVGNDIEPREG